jgi:hypothetical protein
MSHNDDGDTHWYEAQRLNNFEWVVWEQFHYDSESPDSRVRLGARRAAIRSAQDCARKHDCSVRVIYMWQIWSLDRESRAGNEARPTPDQASRGSDADPSNNV